jgi:glycine hydroxymethyltransferase
MQGGPLDHVIAAKAICFEEALRPEFKKYGKQIVLNAKAMEEAFNKRGVRIVSGGTDNHMMVLDITKYSEDSKGIQDNLDSCGICVNRNTIPFETRSPFNPSGIRLGTPGITTRGFKEKECKELANLIVDLFENLESSEVQGKIKNKVSEFCKEFPIYEDFKW